MQDKHYTSQPSGQVMKRPFDYKGNFHVDLHVSLFTPQSRVGPQYLHGKLFENLLKNHNGTSFQIIPNHPHVW